MMEEYILIYVVFPWNIHGFKDVCKQLSKNFGKWFDFYAGKLYLTQNKIQPMSQCLKLKDLVVLIGVVPKMGQKIMTQETWRDK